MLVVIGLLFIILLKYQDPNNITFCFLINMKKIFILVLFISYIFSSCIRYDEKCLPYYLYSVTQKSDINYSMISKLDSFPIGRVKLKNEFYPVFGDYTVLRFLSFSYGQGMESSFETNNVLILKIDENKRLVDGYLYSLQWAEVPVSQALLRITNNKIKIKNRLSISSLFTHKKNDAYGNMRNPKGFLIIPNNIEILESNYIDKKDSKIYSYEPNEFVVECE